MNWNLFERNYWKRYVQLEKEFLEILDYVEFDVSNFSVYSVKLMQLLLSIGSEVEAVLKEVCGVRGEVRSSMADYAPEIIKQFPEITGQKVQVFDYDLSLCPFGNWELSRPAQSLSFWNDYNEVKHHRTENYRKASLEAVANGLAALFVLNMYEFNKIYLSCSNLMSNMPEEESKLFFLEEWTQHIKTSAVKYHYRVFDDDEKKYVL